MTRAAAQNLIKFRVSKLHNTEWQHKLLAIMDQMEIEYDREIAKQRIALAAVSLQGNIAGASPEVTKAITTLKDAAYESLLAVINGYKPWLRLSSETLKKSETDKAWQAYCDAYGISPENYPQYIEQAKKEYNEWVRNRQTRQQTDESTEARLDRLLAERGQ